MEYNLKKLPKSEIELSITLTEQEIAKQEEKALAEAGKELAIKGFRKGHVPANVVREHIGETYITARAQELAIQEAYVDAVMKEKLQVISRPRIAVQGQKPFKFTAIVAVLPEVKLKDYKKIKVPKKEQEATEKDIEELLKDMRKYATTYREVDRVAKERDRVEIDFDGFDEKGEPVANTSSKNHPMVIGDKMMIPGFEEEIIGMKKDEEKEFHITFPKDYHKEDFREKKLKFKVKLNKLEEAVEPEMDEAFVEKMSGKKQPLDEFKKEIAKNILAEKERGHARERENTFLDELLKITTVELPESLIDEEVEYILHDLKHDMEHRGVPFETYLKSSKTTEEDLRKKYRPEAEKRLKVRLALQQIIRDEKLEAAPAEIEAEFSRLSVSYPDLKLENIRNELANQIVLRKLFAKVLE